MSTTITEIIETLKIPNTATTQSIIKKNVELIPPKRYLELIEKCLTTTPGTEYLSKLERLIYWCNSLKENKEAYYLGNFEEEARQLERKLYLVCGELYDFFASDRNRFTKQEEFNYLKNVGLKPVVKKDGKSCYANYKFTDFEKQVIKNLGEVYIFKSYTSNIFHKIILNGVEVTKRENVSNVLGGASKKLLGQNMKQLVKRV